MPPGMLFGPAIRIRLGPFVTSMETDVHPFVMPLLFVVKVSRIVVQQPMERTAGADEPAWFSVRPVRSWNSIRAGMPTWSIPVTSPLMVVTPAFESMVNST